MGQHFKERIVALDQAPKLSSKPGCKYLLNYLFGFSLVGGSGKLEKYSVSDHHACDGLTESKLTREKVGMPVEDFLDWVN